MPPLRGTLALAACALAAAAAAAARAQPPSASPSPSPLPPHGASRAPVRSTGCKNLTATSALDFGATTRSSEFPQGEPGLSLAACQALCCATADCVLFAFLNSTPSTTCWPLSAADGLGPNSDPNHWIGAPPQPPPQPPQPAPASWAPRIAAADLLFASEDTAVPTSQLPMVGNGFLATQIMNDAIWVSGIFNGYLTKDPSHRARVPATNAVPAPGTESAAGLDVREATYFRRSYIDPSPPGTCTAASTQSCSNAAERIFVEQRWFAHRALPSVLQVIFPPARVRARDKSAALARAIISSKSP